MRASAARQPPARPGPARTHNNKSLDSHKSCRKYALTSLSIMSLLALLLTIVALNAVDVHSRFIERANITRNCDTVLEKVDLKRVTMISKYVFTGKVFNVSSMNSTRVYKVNIRRVLKGDLNDIGVVVRFRTSNSLRFSDATVMVESSHSFHCPPLRVRTYAIFLTEKHLEKGTLRLSLVMEPVLLTLRSIGIIEAAIKGKYFI